MSEISCAHYKENLEETVLSAKMGSVVHTSEMQQWTTMNICSLSAFPAVDILAARNDAVQI